MLLIAMSLTANVGLVVLSEQVDAAFYLGAALTAVGGGILVVTERAKGRRAAPNPDRPELTR